MNKKNLKLHQKTATLKSLREILYILAFTVTFIPSVASAISFDNTVLKSVLQIKIYDTVLGQDISWGTGMVISGGEILTNYHVAKLAITNPDRYKVYGCIITSLNNTPNCKHLLSIGGISGKSKSDKNFDLALLHLDKIYVNGTWKSFMDVPLAEFGFLSVNLSDYATNYDSLNIGDTISAIGYPDYGDGKTLQADGVVTKYFTDQKSGQSLIVSDSKISFGNSGGPVFNSNGELVGVTVACFVDPNGKCISGLLIPLPTVNWWYKNQTNSRIMTWMGKKSYSGGEIPDETIKSALCLLRQNAYYDPNVSTDDCTCKSGYATNVVGGDCFAINNNPNKELEDQKINDQTCKNFYDLNSHYKNSDNRGAVVCECNFGYEWNGMNDTSMTCTKKECQKPNTLENDKCVTPDEKCTQAYGQESYWNKTYNQSGGFVCDCKNGYTWKDNICIPNGSPEEKKTLDKNITPPAKDEKDNDTVIKDMSIKSSSSNNNVDESLNSTSTNTSIQNNVMINEIVKKQNVSLFSRMFQSIKRIFINLFTKK